MVENNSLKVNIAFALLCVVWGTTYLGIDIAVDYIPPFMLSALRHLIAGPFFLAYCFFYKKEKMPDKKTLLQLVTMGILLIVGGNAMVCWAEKTIPSGLTAVICSLSPMFITVMSLFIFKEFKITYKIILGLLLGLLGVALIFLKDLSVTLNEDLYFALAALLIAILCWALGSVLLKKNSIKTSIFMNIGWQMVFAGTINMVISYFFEDNSNLLHTEIKGIYALLYLVVAGSLIGYGCYLYVLNYYPPARVSMHTYINTIIAVFVGWLIGGERINEYIVLGTLIVLAGVLIVNKEYARLAEKNNN